MTIRVWPHLLLGLLLLSGGCGMSPNQSDAGNISNDKQTVGVIDSVTQNSPFQMKVKTLDGVRLVECGEKVEVVRGSKPVPRDTLQKGQYVIVTGSTRDAALSASRVELVDGVEGKIEAIMEVFPIRLTVKTKTGNVTVQLEQQTRVFRDKAKIDPGQLKNGDAVRVVGHAAKDLFTASQIDAE